MKQNYQGVSAAGPEAKSSRKSGLGRIGAALLALGLSFGAHAQSADALFRTDAEAQAAAAGAPLAAALTHARPLTLDLAGLRAALSAAPREATGEAPLVLSLPMPDGSSQRFALRETFVMAPALAANFPQIKTYAGQGLDEASASVRLDLSPQGFHAQVLNGGKTFYIDPVNRTDTRHYLGFYAKDMNRAAAGPVMTCEFEPSKAEVAASAARVATYSRAASTMSSGPVLKTYRLAMAATGEYTAFHGGTVASALAAIVTTVNRVVGVYEKELAVRLVLIPNTNQLIYTNAATDPYANTSGDLGANVSNINTVIGSANYDIGHLVGTGGGGVAGLGVVCGASKARGLTGSPSPVGDAFDIDYVAHEMGHQFSGNHPFNGNAGSCAGGNRNASTAWEPGSGTTIMAYAGICTSTNNLQPNSDPTFHTGNFEEMRAFIESTTCATTTATGNTPPVVTAPASGFTLPIGTPFKLTASATDAENDPLTYMWEELDLGPQGSPTDAQVAGQNIPLFRSFVPTASSTRYFPRLSDLVNNTTVLGERLPTVTRTLKFRCTARDQHSGPAGVIGGVDFSALVNLNVTSTAGPFVVTAPNTATTWVGGAAQTVTWNVAGTTGAPVNCAQVNIRLSTDGGLTYPIVLATNETNDGSAVVVAPTTASTTARIMVEAADNYFFDISNTNFTISPPVTGPTITSFTPTGGLAGTVVTILGSNFTGATSVSFNGTAAATYTVNSPTQITATVATGTTTGPITIVTPNGSVTSSASFFVGAPPVITSFTPTSGAAGTSVVITGTDFTGATQVTFNGTLAPTFTVNSSTQITVTVPTGATTGPIGVTTPVASATSTGIFTVIAPPVITSFTPTTGQAGTNVTITGANFTGATQVTFNGTASTNFVVNSATSISVTVPAGATTGPIAVTGPGGVGTSTTNFVIPPANDRCANAIALTCGQSVTGSTLGSTATGDPTASCGGETVDGGGVFYTITGTGASITVSTCNAGTTYDTKLFVYSGTCNAYTCVGGNDDAAGCSFAQGFASSVTFNSTAGTTYYVFVSGYGGATGAFNLSTTCATPPPAPTITSLAPNAGPIASGMQINGTNFTGVTRVTFNGTSASYFVVDAQTILATVPNTTTGNVVVTNAGGPSNGVLFTVTTPQPTLTTVNPTSGNIGTTITLTGTGFGGATSVTFNGRAATTFNVSSATSMTAVVPTGATTGNVVVTTPGGTTNGVLFTVNTASATASANNTEFSVWPNPVAGKQNIHVTLTTAAAVGHATLRNVLGQTVATGTFSGKTTEMSTTGLASGTYLLTVQTDSHNPTIRRVVVE